MYQNSSSSLFNIDLVQCYYHKNLIEYFVKLNWKKRPSPLPQSFPSHSSSPPLILSARRGGGKPGIFNRKLWTCQIFWINLHKFAPNVNEKIMLFAGKNVTAFWHQKIVALYYKVTKVLSKSYRKMARSGC